MIESNRVTLRKSRGIQIQHQNCYFHEASTEKEVEVKAIYLQNQRGNPAH